VASPCPRQRLRWPATQPVLLSNGSLPRALRSAVLTALAKA